MKYFFASDIHGDLAAARGMKQAFEREGAERLFLLGDLLYHGPRNHIPTTYDPKGVIALLDGMREKICAVRGNCDAEVDQMVLSFPILADYAVFSLPHGTAYLTHGHLFGGGAPTGMKKGDVLIEGHTHIAGVTYDAEGNACLNPGSVSMPKGDTPACYMIYDTEACIFSIRRLLDGSEYRSFKIS